MSSRLAASTEESLLTDVMRETIHTVAPGARLVRLTVPPVVGAVMLGMEQAGVDFASAAREAHRVGGASERAEGRLDGGPRHKDRMDCGVPTLACCDEDARVGLPLVLVPRVHRRKEDSRRVVLALARRNTCAVAIDAHLHGELPAASTRQRLRYGCSKSPP